MDNAGNVSSSFAVNTTQDLLNRPNSLLIDVVSNDNVISAVDATAPVNVSIKLSGAKVGDVVKLQTPVGVQDIEVVQVTYPAPSADLA